ADAGGVVIRPCGACGRVCRLLRWAEATADLLFVCLPRFSRCDRLAAATLPLPFVLLDGCSELPFLPRGAVVAWFILCGARPARACARALVVLRPVGGCAGSVGSARADAASVRATMPATAAIMRGRIERVVDRETDGAIFVFDSNM